MCLGTAHSTAWSISVRLGSFADLGWTLMCLGLAGAAELTGLCSSSLRPAQQYFLSKVGKQGRDPKGVERLMHRLELIHKHFCHCLSNRSFGQVQGQVWWVRGDLGSSWQWVELHSHPAKGAGTRMGGGRGQLQLTYKRRALGKSRALSGPALSSLKEEGGWMILPAQLP